MTARDDLPGDSFLARRARLKAARQRAARGRDEAVDTAKTPVRDAAAPPPAADGTPPATGAAADLPAPETLDEGADFTRYLADGVSSELRRAALRRLFHLPQFNVLDGLNDYDDDYSGLEKLGDALTYQKRRLLAEDEARERRANGDRAAADDVSASTTEAAGPGDEAADATPATAARSTGTEAPGPGGEEDDREEV